jgi:hypothetical protein
MSQTTVLFTPTVGTICLLDSQSIISNTQSTYKVKIFAETIGLPQVGKLYDIEILEIVKKGVNNLAIGHKMKILQRLLRPL